MTNKLNETSRHTGRPVSTYVLMHADELVAIAHKESNSVDIKRPDKLPFGLRKDSLDFIDFNDWLNRRVTNLQRTYMNKVYMARKIGRELDNILRDSCALSITDQFWVNRSDLPEMTWEKLQERRDQNETLNNVALSGNTANLDWKAVVEGTTSLFTTKGQYPKAIYQNTMIKGNGTQEREWVATVIGEALGLPVQKTKIINPSMSGSRNTDGTKKLLPYFGTDGLYFCTDGVLLTTSNSDDTLVEIELFTNQNTSLVLANELLWNEPGFKQACADGIRHRFFYDRLPNDDFKRDFERVLILNWLVSNHDMHEENFGCLYNPKTFELTSIAPSFDHNSSDYDALIPDLDIPDIVKPALVYHDDVIGKIKAGKLEEALSVIGEWLTDEQKDGIRKVGAELVAEYEKSKESVDAHARRI